MDYNDYNEYTVNIDSLHREQQEKLERKNNFCKNITRLSQ